MAAAKPEMAHFLARRRDQIGSKVQRLSPYFKKEELRDTPCCVSGNWKINMMIAKPEVYLVSQQSMLVL